MIKRNIKCNKNSEAELNPKILEKRLFLNLFSTCTILSQTVFLPNKWAKKWGLPVASDKIKRPKATRAISLHWRLHNWVMTSVVRWPLRPAFCCNHKVWHCPFWARSSRLNTGWNINKFGWKLRGSSQLTEGAWARAELEKIMRACSHAQIRTVAAASGWHAQLSTWTS